MVPVHVGDENLGPPMETHLSLDHLALGSLTTVKEEEFPPSEKGHSGQAPFRGGNAPSSSKEYQLQVRQFPHAQRETFVNPVLIMCLHF